MCAKSTSESIPVPVYHTPVPLTLRSGTIDFTNVLLGSTELDLGEGNYGLAGIILSTLGKPEKLFSKEYSCTTPNLSTVMNGDLHTKIIEPSTAKGQIPIIAFWTNNMDAAGWNSSPEFIVFLESCGAGPLLHDINQKATQLGSAIMEGFGYIVVSKWGISERYEASDINNYPSASLSLNLTPFSIGGNYFLEIKELD